jgi:hypothetical protein
MRFPLPLIASLTIACSGGGSTTTTIDSLPGGIQRIVNHGPSEWVDSSGWRLVLERTIQPSPGEPGELLNGGWPALRADGSLLVSDGPPIGVKLFGPDGTYLRTIGHEGDGPGEFRSAYAAWLGDTVFVQDTRGAGRGLTFLADGSHLETFPAVCCVGGTGPRADDAGRIRLLAPGVSEPGRFTYQWLWIDSRGTRLDSMPQPRLGEPRTWTIDQGGGGVATYSVPLAPSPVAQTLSDGRIIAGFGSRYDLVELTRGGDTVRVFGRDDVTPAVVPDSVREARYQAMVAALEGRPGANLDDIPTVHPYISTLDEDERGNLWVGRPAGDGTVASYDVFSPEGFLLGPVPSPWRAVWFTSWSGGRVAVVDLDSNDLPRVRIYRIERGQS